MTMNSSLNIVELSDVHLGHRTTPTTHIIESFYKLIPGKIDPKQIDLLIIAGDLFDRLLNVPSHDHIEIQKFCYWLLRLCKDNDIVLRVLEGTPSHDNKQNMLLAEINEHSNIGCDLKYHDKLDIDRIDRFGIDVLYVPDEWHPDPSETLKQVRTLLSQKNLSQVDFAVMHGQFDYQVPTNLRNRIVYHDSKSYLELVKYLIFIGHVHQTSQLDRILAAGSLDRLSHGDEGNKGLIQVTVHPNGNFDAKFIVNKNAMVYKTVELSSVPIKSALKQLDEIVSNLPSDSFVRIRCSKDDQLASSLKDLKVIHPKINWKIETEKSASAKTVEIQRPDIKMDTLQPESIISLVRQRLDGSYDKRFIESCITRLKEVIDE